MTGTPEPGPSAAARGPARVVAFSDGVIAIAVTLLVLNLHPPTDSRHLLHGLATLWPSYVSYVITFMLVAHVRANHHVLFEHIRHVDRLLLFLNAVLLMDIAFLPFAASVLADAFHDGQGERTAVVLHGLDDAGVRAIARRFQLALAWIGAATVLGALVPLLGVSVFVAFLAYYWLPVSGELGLARTRPAPPDPEAPLRSADRRGWLR